MDLNKAQLLLDKINRLYKSMSLDPQNVAQIEKDLMRDYVKLLYGAFLEEERTVRPVKTVPPPRIVETPKAATPRVVVQAKPAPKRAERIIAPPPVERIIKAPVVEEVIVDSPPPAPTHQPRASTPPPQRFDTNEDQEQLFEMENGTELSHKLSSLPIGDLNKAMGINERIFTINELFRGDSRAFKHTMDALNQLSSFQEARAYLAQHIVNDFDWTNRIRKNKAKNFIKLIRRRYI